MAFFLVKKKKKQTQKKGLSPRLKVQRSRRNSKTDPAGAAELSDVTIGKEMDTKACEVKGMQIQEAESVCCCATEAWNFLFAGKKETQT